MLYIISIPNICSLHAGLGHLELLIANPNHTIDIIGVSET